MQRLRLTKSMKGGILRNPTDVTPTAWIARVLKVLHSLPDRLLAIGSTKRGFHLALGLTLLGERAMDHGNEENRLRYFTETLRSASGARFQRRVCVCVLFIRFFLRKRAVSS